MRREMIVLMAGLIALILFTEPVSAIVVEPAPIPEFSNIAIPLVTIFGLLLFVYHRRRSKRIGEITVREAWKSRSFVRTFLSTILPEG